MNTNINKMEEGIKINPSMLTTPPAIQYVGLRDYFAAHAIGNLIANESVLEAANEAKLPVSQVVASIAYEIADAMLKVREVKDGQFSQ